MASAKKTVVEQRQNHHFRFRSLPQELQFIILSLALEAGTSPTNLLSLTPALYADVVFLLYSRLAIPSIEKLHHFLSSTSNSSKYAKDYTRSITFHIPGVPGGNMIGGRTSVPGSPAKTRNLDDRLLRTSQAILLCPNLRHCSIEMYGVRHSSLLTSNDYIAEEANAFRKAISQLKHLQTFTWIPPETSQGISVAFVDLTFEPLIEGLEEAALDLDSTGRRRRLNDEDKSQRYHHPLEQITLHNAIFPSNQGRAFFRLFATKHPDDEEFLLFPRLNLICIKKSTNVNPINVAFLALSWQLYLDRDSEYTYQAFNWNPIIEMEDVFVGSLWGPIMTDNLIRQHVEHLVQSCYSCTNREQAAIAHSDNAYIRALEESVEMNVKLDEEVKEQIKQMSQQQLERLVSMACKRIRVQSVEGAVASYQ